jgi:NADP-dependent 3-hydroxy acid dehydrogenase YdfG
MLAISRSYPQKRAFVTGAASGLGYALCEALAADAWTIGMADLRADALESAAARLRDQGARVIPFVLDVTDRIKYRKTAEDFIAQAGGIDLLVNNAGVAVAGPVGEVPLEDWDWLMSINLMGVVNGCHFFVPHFKRQRSGHIINTASAAAFVPVPRMAAYCSAKAGVRMLSEVLYGELHEDGVGVTVVMPEFFRTNLHERTRGQDRDMGHYLITNAPYSAQEVAHAALDAAARRQLHLVFGREANVLWRLIRWFPKWTLHRIRRSRAAREEEVQRKLAASRNAATE